MQLSKYLAKIQEVHGKGLIRPSPELVGEALTAIEGHINSFFKEQKQRFPRPSSLGYKARRLWLMSRNPETKAEFPWQTSLTGNVMEAVIIYLLKEAGCPIEGVQQRVSGKLADFDIEGSVDFITTWPDGSKRIVDVKTCSDFSWSDNFGSEEKFASKNPYGYLTQAAVYEHLAGIKFGGWLVYNKSSGEMKFLDADKMRTELFEAFCTASDALLRVSNDTMPEQCHPVHYEEYKGEQTGNIKVSYDCAKCPFIKTCFPSAVKATRGRTVMYYLGQPERVLDGVKVIIEQQEEEQNNDQTGD